MANKKDKVIIAYKGFNKDWKCRGFQFEAGKSYSHDGDVKMCSSGFHACEYPLDVFSYYPPGSSNYALVEMTKPVINHDGDSKIASAHISISAEIDIAEIIKQSINWITLKCNKRKSKHSTGYRSASSATGDSSASSATGYSSASSATGYSSASSATGDRSASSATGYSSASSATGDSSASSATGDSSASSATGDSSASSATGYSSASSATGDSSASSATGYRSASSATGDSSASSATGDRSASVTTGVYSRSDSKPDTEGQPHFAFSTGANSSAKAMVGGAITLCNYDDDNNLRHIKSSKVGENGVKADTWYILNDNGEFVEPT